MRRGKKGNNLCGMIAVTLGIVILLSRILPVNFWWFMLGAALIACGVTINRRC